MAGTLSVRNALSGDGPPSSSGKPHVQFERRTEASALRASSDPTAMLDNLYRGQVPPHPDQPRGIWTEKPHPFLEAVISK